MISVKLNILKYMLPPQVIRYLELRENAPEIVHIARYLLRIHFPWMPLSVVEDKGFPQGIANPYIYLYKQAYLSTLNEGDPLFQSVYNFYIEPILMNTIGDNFWMNQQKDYVSLYNYIRKNPSLVQDAIREDLSLAEYKAIELNSDTVDL